MARALIIVDVQHDFCEGGSLAVEGGIEVARRISDHVREHGQDYATVAATADWHIDPGSHWSPEPDFVDSWPVHCEADTPGAQFRPELEPALQHVAGIFRKGQYDAGYSGFSGTLDAHGRTVGLTEWLKERDITEVDVVGIATDHCVRATSLDAVRAGFDTTVLLDLTAGVAPESVRAAVAEMGQAGITVRDPG